MWILSIAVIWKGVRLNHPCRFLIQKIIFISYYEINSLGLFGHFWSFNIEPIWEYFLIEELKSELRVIKLARSRWRIEGFIVNLRVKQALISLINLSWDFISQRKLICEAVFWGNGFDDWWAFHSYDLWLNNGVVNLLVCGYWQQAE